MATALSGDNTTAWTVDGADTVAANSVAGATAKPIIFDLSPGGATTGSLTVTGAGTADVGAITNIDADNGSDTADLIIGDGSAATIFIINGIVTGNSTGGASTVAGNDLDIAMIGVNGGSGAQQLKFYGNVDAETNLISSGDANGINTITLGNGSLAMTFAGTISMGAVGTASVDILTLAAGGAELSGALDLAANGGTTLVINMAAGSSITGAVTDTADATLVTVNVGGDATIGSGTNVFEAGSTAATNIAVANSMTLTLAGTGAISGGNVDFDLTGTSSVLKVTGAKTITAAIDGASGGDGTLDIDANLTFTGVIGATAIKAVTIADSVTFMAGGNVSATNITIGSTATGTGVLDVNAGITIVAATDGFAAGYGTLDIDNALTHTGAIGASKALGLIDVGAATTFSTTVAATTMNFSADVTAIFNGSTTAAITTGGASMGTIDVNGAATITGAIGTNGGYLLKLLDIDAALTTTSTVDATTVDLAASTTHTAQGDITAAYNFSGDGTLALADLVDVTGAITATTNTEGTITVAGTSIITGAVGHTSGPKRLKAVTLTTDSKLSVSSDFHAAATTIGDGAELHFTHATAAAALGTITNSGSGTGKLNVGTATVTVTGTTTINGTGTLKMTIGANNATTGKLVCACVFATTTKIEPVIDGTITSGTVIVIGTDSTNQFTNTPSAATIVDNYARYDFTVAISTNDLQLTPTLVTPTGVSAAGAAISAVAHVAFAADATMANAINGLSGAVLDKALITLAPAVDGGAIVGAVSAGAASGATISTQMASLRSGIAAGQGLNAGDGTATEERFWTQGFGTYAEQDIRDKIAGFTSTTGGVALGVDKRFRGDLVLGVAYSFSHTYVNSSESKNETQVQGHQATLYGSHDFDKGIFGTDGVFLDGQLSYAYNDYDGERFIEVGAVSRRADSSYEGLQISTKFDLGTTIKLDDGFRFTPTAGFSYSHVSIDSYSETNAGDSSLKLQDQGYDILNLNLKGKIANTWQVDGIDLTPEVHLGYSYGAIHDKIQTVSTFQGGGDAFTSTGFSPANNTYLAGIGVTWGGDSMPVDVTLTYDAAYKEDFLSHSALVKGVWKF